MLDEGRKTVGSGDCVVGECTLTLLLQAFLACFASLAHLLLRDTFEPGVVLGLRICLLAYVVAGFVEASLFAFLLHVKRI